MTTPKPSFFAELQRRNVYKVGAMYAVAGWLLVQIVTQVLPVFDVSALGQRILVLIVMAGFPVALVLAWLFDLTPQGIVRTGDAPTSAEAPAVELQRRGMGRRLNYILGLLLMMAVAYFMAERLGWVAGARPTGSVSADKSIAVLPFDNLSDDKANTYFAEGIQDEILTRLAGIGDLKVISRTSTEKYKSHPDNLRTVAAELGVGRVLEGSVQRAGDKVRVNVQLIDAAADAHLWASTYDRDLKDVFAVESEVSQDIAEALKAHLTAGESKALAQVPTHNAAAYDAFLKGEYELHQAQDWGELAKIHFPRAADAYRQALALDPAFALAHAQLAFCLLLQRWETGVVDAAALVEAQAEAQRALALAPNLPEARLALGYYDYYGLLDYEQARTQFEQALALAPGSEAELLSLARIQRRTNQWAQALASMEQALTVAPRSTQVLGDYGETLLLVRRYDDAEAILKRALALDPNDNNAATNLFLVRLLGHGDLAGARAAYANTPQNQIMTTNGVGGDVLNVMDPPLYADVIERRYSDVLKAWDALPLETDGQRLQRSAARAALAVLSGRQREFMLECAQLKDALQSRLTQDKRKADGLGWLSWAELCLGHPDLALDAARGAVELVPYEKDSYGGSNFLVGEAQIAAQAGKPDMALPLLERLLSISAGQVVSPQRLKLDPVWDPLRGDPRFQKLVTGGGSP